TLKGSTHLLQAASDFLDLGILGTKLAGELRKLVLQVEFFRPQLSDQRRLCSAGAGCGIARDRLLISRLLNDAIGFGRSQLLVKVVELSGDDVGLFVGAND